VCRFLLFSLFRWSCWQLSVGSPGFYVLDFVLKPVTGVELPNEVFTSRARWMPLIVEWNASANMFYLLKSLLLLILVIFKLKCDNLILKEIMVLNASYVCLHAFSLRRESPDPNSRRRTPHFWGGSVRSTYKAGPHWHFLDIFLYKNLGIQTLLNSYKTIYIRSWSESLHVTLYPVPEFT
jgi:hypothetical protein